MNKEIQNFLTEHLGALTGEMIPIKKGGSDRNFFRVGGPDRSSFIFMHYGTEVAENSCWVDINKFLSGINVAVPRIIAQDLKLRFLLVEDLGDLDLWSQRFLPWNQRRGYYCQVLGEIRKLHAFDLALLPSGLQLTESYNAKLYRWEQNYFLENFVGAVCQLEMSSVFQKELERELAGLTARLQKIEPSLIHRDFQSQNILLQGGRPVLIDFQGMRQGCLFYDLGSLICDPYVIFTASEREELLYFYYELMKPEYSLAVFTGYFWEAAAQRLMQALGAYGFLGLKKNKPDFLAHIDNGSKNLLTATTSTSSLPVLRELAGLCIKTLAQN
jgi:N-acetylmuramate 1-kinase